MAESCLALHSTFPQNGEREEGIAEYVRPWNGQGIYSLSRWVWNWKDVQREAAIEPGCKEVDVWFEPCRPDWF